MNRALLTTAAAALVVLLVWISLDGSDADLVPPIESPEDVAATSAEPAIAVIAAEDEATRSDAELLRAPMPATTDSPTAGEDCELMVRVRLHDATPAPFVTVVASPPFVADARQEERNVVTDEQGTARFTLPAGSYACRTSLGASANVVLQSGHEHELELTLPASPIVRGFVVDESGAPIEGAEILVLGLTSVGTARTSARSAADGAFSLPGIGAGRQVAAKHALFAPTAPQRIELADATAATVTIRMQRPHGHIEGLVTTREGMAIANAVVWFGARANADKPDANAARTPTFPSHVVRTAVDGSFRSEALPEGPIEIRATAAGHSLRTLSARVSPAAISRVAIALDGGGRVRGIARLADGSPAKLGIVYSGVRRSIGSRLAQTDDTGAFVLDRLPLDEVELTALALAADGVTQQRATMRLIVREGQDAEWNPTLAEIRRGAVQGIVRDDNDAPLQGWLVLATPRGQRKGLGTETLADGSFAMQGLQSPGIVDIAVRKPESGWQSFPAALLEGVAVDGDAVVIRVMAKDGSRAQITGTAQDENGKPCASTVRVVHERSGSAQQATRLDGSFRIEGIPQGTVRVELRRDGAAALTLPPFSLRGNEARDLGALTLTTGGAAFGKLLSIDGSPAPNVSMRLLGSGDRDLGPIATDALGYRTETLLAGRYEMIVQAESLAPARVALTIARGQDTELDIQLLPGSLHRIRVQAARAEDRDAKVSLVLFDASGKAAWIANLPMTQGVAEFRAFLADGEYQALALGVQNQRAQGSFTVEAARGEPGLTSLQLGR